MEKYVYLFVDYFHLTPQREGARIVALKAGWI